MHRRVTDIENIQKPRKPEESTDQTNCSTDFVDVISVQEAMNIDKIYYQYRGQYIMHKVNRI